MGAYHAYLGTAIYRKYPHTAPLERVSRTPLGYRHRTPLECKTLLPM